MSNDTANNSQSYRQGSQQPEAPANREDMVVIPVIEESVHIDKQLVETGKLRIIKTVQQEEQVIDLPLSHEEFDVEHVAVNEYVDTPPAVRYEGDTTVYPVLKEVLVIEKKLVLVEEVRITKRLVTASEPQRVLVRKEEVSVERISSELGRSAL
ncbi:YsnF/AvaK domain-containing protein [Spirosoma fluviale]|uniref:Conserved domain-containing protein n=1 Tax=Spirosoma fluviale TaxID=1597977 RepID=A0A286F951_9BACT|nr:YsnF/AvaK domain-containing protein [Spirosoma fluviale]SOD79740.1 conserved domain-containing protein [Spirosoma fluviale]